MSNKIAFDKYAIVKEVKGSLIHGVYDNREQAREAFTKDFGDAFSSTGLDHSIMPCTQGVYLRFKSSGQRFNNWAINDQGWVVTDTDP